MGGDAGEAEGGKSRCRHQSAKVSSTGEQGGQLHLVAALQPHKLNSGQSRSGSVLAGWEEAGVPAARGNGSGSALEAPAGAGGH